MAEHFMAVRNPRIGAATMRAWTSTLSPGATVLDLGCGHGVPISQVLIEAGFAVYGVDASATMTRAFRERFPGAHAECSTVEDSKFFGRLFDGISAIGLMFLLKPSAQAHLIRKVGSALKSDGKFVFTSPTEAASWSDSLTARDCFSLGRKRYEELLRSTGLCIAGETSDEGGSHYYFVEKSG